LKQLFYNIHGISWSAMLINSVYILAAQTAQNVVFELSYSRNPNFIKRSTIMSELKGRLELERYVALSGIGGVG
jgi:hypothetical protein